MGKYQQSSNLMPSKPKPTQVHPIWRGIGCILFLISPLMRTLLQLMSSNGISIRDGIHCQQNYSRPSILEL